MKLPIPCLALITDRRLCERLSLEEAVARAIGGGINVVQLREKDLAAAELVPLADRLRAITRDKALLIVNSHLDVALICGADGVHLPERGPSVAATRRLAGNGLIIGRSVHSVEEAVKAEEEGADYVQVGAIFPTRSHPGPPPGTGLLESVAARVSIPIVAVGGITARNVGEVMQAGARGAAVISAILGSPSPGAAARRLAEAMVEAAAVPARRMRT
ncbi:MAG: thiamine phosphate synthase [Dehalococcoidia bacterium]|nr:MAG: thiamine phosphate synthase [Dehalococcoidia bacterium]